MFPILPLALVGIGAKLVFDELNSKKNPVHGIPLISPIEHSSDGDLSAKSPKKKSADLTIAKWLELYPGEEQLQDEDEEQLQDEDEEQLQDEDEEQLQDEDEEDLPDEDEEDLPDEDEEQLQEDNEPELIPPRKRGRPRKVKDNGN